MPEASQPVALVIGGSRGMGRQIAISLASEGYTVVVAGKSISDPSSVSPFPPDPNSPQSTISTVAHEIKLAGGTASAIACDVRSAESIASLISQTVARHARIDALVYNSGAIWWASVENTPLKRFELMQAVNIHGLYATIQAALPVFASQGWKGRVVVVSPPIYSRFFRGKTAYAMGKVGMSVLTKGLAMDWVREGKKNMSITSLWPAVAIESGATRNVADRSQLRTAKIFGDAVVGVIASQPETVNGLLELDEDFLRKYRDWKDADFEQFNLVKGAKPRRIMPKEFPDLTVAEQDDEGNRMDSHTERQKTAAKL